MDESQLEAGWVVLGCGTHHQESELGVDWVRTGCSICWQRSRLGMGHTRLAQSRHGHMHDLWLREALVRELKGCPG